MLQFSDYRFFVLCASSYSVQETLKEKLAQICFFLHDICFHESAGNRKSRIKLAWKERDKQQHSQENYREEVATIIGAYSCVLNFSGHICSMRDARLLKQVFFGKTDGKDKRVRSKRRRNDDLVDWRKKDTWTLYGLQMDRTKWS